MSFKAPDIPPPAAVAPPPNPPMFGSQAPKKKMGGQPSQEYSGSVLGTLPTNTAQKSLIGQ